MCYLERDYTFRIASNRTGLNCMPPNQSSTECRQNISLLMSITFRFLGYLIDLFILIEPLSKAKTNMQFSSCYECKFRVKLPNTETKLYTKF